MGFRKMYHGMQMDKRWWATIISGVATAIATIITNFIVYVPIANADLGSIYPVVGVGLPVVTLAAFLVSTLFQRHADIVTANETRKEVRDVGNNVVDRVVAAIGDRGSDAGGTRVDMDGGEVLRGKAAV